MRPIRARASLGALALALSAGAAAVGCGDHGAATRRPELPAPTLRLLVVTDLKGYLEPCGCTSRPLGGIDRMAAAMARARADHVPTLAVAAGDLLFDGVAHAGVAGPEANTQDVWKAETLTQILQRVELAAAAPGASDFSKGADTFVRLARGARFAVLGQGVSVAQATGAYALPGSVVKDVGGTRVGIIGVAELAGPSGAAPEGVTNDGTAVVRATAAAARARQDGAQVIVALVTGSRRTAREIARQVPGIDFIVEGGLDDADVAPPVVVGRTVMLHAARQGHGVLVVDVYRQAAAPGGGHADGWRDVGEWSIRAERARLDRRIADLRGRIAAWERDRAADRAQVAEQRARLAELERERAGLSPHALDGDGFAARWEELGPEARSDAAVARIVDAYDARVNDHNQRVFASVRAPEPAPGQARYVGSDSCAQGQCHGEAYAQWRTTPHAHAYATLTTRHKQFNLSCVGCHVTGYQQPGGSTVAHVEGLIDVGCENCHGPGSLHVADPTSPSTLVRAVPETVCARCHTPEHSDLFQYAAYRERVLGPGHGRPMPGGRRVVGQREGGT